MSDLSNLRLGSTGMDVKPALMLNYDETYTFSGAELQGIIDSGRLVWAYRDTINQDGVSERQYYYPWYCEMENATVSVHFVRLDNQNGKSQIIYSDNGWVVATT